MASLEKIESLVEELKNGNKSAFNELFLLFQKPIYYLAMRIVGNHHDADEMVQKTFLQVYQNIHLFRGESSFKTWLYRICVNLCKDHRKSKEQQIIKISLEAPSLQKLGTQANNPTQSLEKEDRTKFLLHMINRLSDQQKTTVMLRIFEDMAFKEIAHVLECKESTAKVHYHQAMLKLKTLLKETTYDMQGI